MIPCHICGKDASTGWIRGFAPAPDSQKMALCAEHNTQENRLAVAKVWQEMLREQIADLNDVTRQKAGSVEHLLNVHFTGGGMLSFVCTACKATEHGSLKVESPDGALTFIPLSHIRDYTLRPLSAPAAVEKETRLNSGKEIPEDEAATASLRKEPASLPSGDDGKVMEAETAPEHEPDTGPEGFFFNKADTSFAAALPFSRKEKDPA